MMSAELESLRALGQFPIIQAALFIVIVGSGAYAIYAGLRERKPNGAPILNALNVHDTMNLIRELSEQSRELNRILVRIEEMMKQTGKAQWEACRALVRLEDITERMSKDQRERTLLLEDIRNNQVQRGDITPSPVRRR